jgi:hypothetical protein
LVACGTIEVQEFKSYTESIDQDNQLEVSIAPVRTPRQKKFNHLDGKNGNI